MQSMTLNQTADRTAPKLLRILALVGLLIGGYLGTTGIAAAQGGLSFSDYKKLYDEAVSSLEVCQHNHKVLQQRLKQLEQGPDEGGMYDATKEVLERFQKCINRLNVEIRDLEKKLDELRNTPGVVAPAEGEDRGQNPPRGWDPDKFELSEKELKELQKLWEDAMKNFRQNQQQFGQIPPPEDH